MSTRRIITLLTDFGSQDPFVGIMKGVILCIHPEARIVDLTHHIPPQSVETAAFVLAASWRYFPRGTIHTVVVDPGVGSHRRMLALESEGHTFVGPDNGVFSPLFDLPSRKIHTLENRAYFLPDLSATFHGRDVFAPVAAHLARGVELAELGPAIEDNPVRIGWPQPEIYSDKISCKIIYIDKFGNAFSALRGQDLHHVTQERKISIRCGSLRLETLSSAYADVPPGGPLALINSWGYLELAINQGNCALEHGLKVGDELTVVF